MRESKTCPTCGEGNELERTFCWVCYRRLQPNDETALKKVPRVAMNVAPLHSRPPAYSSTRKTRGGARLVLVPLGGLSFLIAVGCFWFFGSLLLLLARGDVWMLHRQLMSNDLTTRRIARGKVETLSDERKREIASKLISDLYIHVHGTFSGFYDEREHKYAVEALEAVGPFGIPYLSQALYGKDIGGIPLPKDRGVYSYLFTGAIKVLASFGPAAKEAVPALVSALRLNNASIKVEACKALAAIGPDAFEALPALLGTIDSTNSDVVRNEAMDAVQVIDIRRIEQARNERMTQKAAASILIRLLTQANPGVRQRAIDCLNQLGPNANEALPILARLQLDFSPAVRKAAKAAYYSISGGRPPTSNTAESVRAGTEFGRLRDGEACVSEAFARLNACPLEPCDSPPGSCRGYLCTVETAAFLSSCLASARISPRLCDGLFYKDSPYPVLDWSEHFCRDHDQVADASCRDLVSSVGKYCVDLRRMKKL